MILFICIVIALVIILVVYIIKGIYINKFSLEGNLKGFKLYFETKKDASSHKK